ncbi:hypothetical protein AT15_07495 [Kosmotoga arenicorallina S304]|uniref:ABC transporter domain-containing protein n=1 Tax=Kosmotoga arenicorallina S304 TaxID=1453497 RepID=A0A176K2X6_9BACT|nr:ABC transporter ATP-binding protein [Kosmotoga arenicorallina]OAA31332.1 hypothetical protein AT15_07495 [Kosmotoga arenicorallina S304]
MLVEAKSISKEFNGVEIIGDFSIEVMRGEFLSILGESGCGKTTLLKILSGILKPDKGNVIRKFSKQGFVFQDDRLIPWKDAFYNVKIVSDEKRAKISLEKVGMAEHSRKRPAQLSGGMIKRVCLARALALDPEIIFLDEPFSSLDIVTRMKLLDMLRKIWMESSCTAVMVTHDPFEAAFLSTRVIVTGNKFKHFHIIKSGSPLNRSLSEVLSLQNELIGLLEDTVSGGRKRTWEHFQRREGNQKRDKTTGNEDRNSR